MKAVGKGWALTCWDKGREGWQIGGRRGVRVGAWPKEPEFLSWRGESTRGHPLLQGPHPQGARAELLGVWGVPRAKGKKATCSKYQVFTRAARIGPQGPRGSTHRLPVHHPDGKGGRPPPLQPPWAHPHGPAQFNRAPWAPPRAQFCCGCMSVMEPGAR